MHKTTSLVSTENLSILHGSTTKDTGERTASQAAGKSMAIQKSYE